MSDVRDYLTEKAAQGEKEWLRREPRTTHPEVLRLVREATIDEDARTVYDDDVERAVNEAVGDLPPHERHGADRNPLVRQLGHEVYIARTICRDERSRERNADLRREGYLPIGEAEPTAGERYMLRGGTLYSGYSVPVFGRARPVKLVRHGERWGYVEKRKRTAYYVPDHALIRPGWEPLEVRGLAMASTNGADGGEA